MDKLKPKISIYALLLVIIVVTWVSSNYNWGGTLYKGILRTDATGYYAYLPAIFIYNDLNFNFIDTLKSNPYYHRNMNFDFRESHAGVNINKFYCGVALMQTPFFITAHVISDLCGNKPDGYSKYYQIFVQIATIVFLLAGLAIIRRLLFLYNIPYNGVALILIVLVFGTNIFHYTVSEPGMSHIYSLFSVSGFLYYQKKFFLTLSPRFWAFSIVFLALVTLIRPVNFIIVFSVPFIAGTYFMLRKGLSVITKKYLFLVISLLVFVSLVSIQLFIYRIQTGSFFIYSYKEEGFNFLTPHFVDFLFSYRKGLFIYTPVLFIILAAGLPNLLTQNPYMAISWLVFFIVTTYVLSSWHLWYYGGSFSARVFIEYYPFFAILLGLFIKSSTMNKSKKIVVMVLIFLTLYCQVQTYQYRTGRIHWSDMDKEMYWNSVKNIPGIIKK